VQGTSDMGLIPMFFPDYKSVVNPEIKKWFEEFWGTSLNPKTGLTVVEIVDAVNKADFSKYLRSLKPKKNKKRK